MSEEANEANMVAISSADDTLGELPQPQQQQEITIKDRPHMSIDELLKVIKGANGMPVLFVPSSDGRLVAVAVDGLQNMVPTKREDSGPSDGNNHRDFRAWLLLLASLIATVTFTAGLAPPGGFWSADDNTNGYIAGTPVMSNKFPRRYMAFYYCNTTAFCASLTVIGALAKNNEITVMNNRKFGSLVGLCFMSLGGSYITGTSSSLSRGVYGIILFVAVGTYISMHWFVDSIARIIRPILAKYVRPILAKYGCLWREMVEHKDLQAARR